jgi:hypothetical protein
LGRLFVLAPIDEPQTPKLIFSTPIGNLWGRSAL